MTLPNLTDHQSLLDAYASAESSAISELSCSDDCLALWRNCMDYARRVGLNSPTLDACGVWQADCGFFFCVYCGQSEYDVCESDACCNVNI